MRNGKLRFDGQIKWPKGTNTIQWSEQLVDPATKEVVMSINMAVFADEGTKATNKRCKLRIPSFAMTGDRAEQYQRIHPVLDQLWNALVHKFGSSTFKEVVG